MKSNVKKLWLKLKAAHAKTHNIFSRRGAITVNFSGRNVEFDAAYYRKHYPDIGNQRVDPFTHFVMFGAPEGRFPNSLEEIRSLVDDDYYRETYPEVAANGLDPVEDFWTNGKSENRSPNLYFDTAYYLNTNPAALESGLNPLLHYLQEGRVSGHNPSPWFDEPHYRAQYADIDRDDVVALSHFMHIGVREHRSPIPHFNGDFYVSAYPEMLESGWGAFEHFIRVGARAGNNPCPEFDPEFYRTHCMDDASREAGCLPQYHFLQFGLAANKPIAPRYPNSEFLPSRLDAPRFVARTPLPLVVILPGDEPDAARHCAAGLESTWGTQDFDIVRLERGVDSDTANSLDTILRQNAKRDVVLLDSACRPDAGGLDKLAAHAYRDANIASVTPFMSFDTNGASNHIDTLLALPNLSNVASDPNAIDANRGRWIDLPAPGALCTYIRRAAIDAIEGVFDEHNLTKALSTFASRSIATGRRHILAGDILVGRATSRTQPHGSEWQPLDSDSVRRHELFATADPAMPFRFAAMAQRYRTSGLPVLLIVSHSLGGGTARYVDELTRQLSGQAHCLILEPLCGKSWNRQSNRNAVLRPAEAEGNFRLIIDTQDDYAHLLDVLRSCGVTKVSLQHFLFNSLNLQQLIDDLDVPFDFTAHDYFTICPYVNLTTPDAEYCGEPDTTGCNRCIAARDGHGARDILWWRRSFDWVYRRASRVICPSQDTADRLARYYPFAALVVADHAELQPDIDLDRAVLPVSIAENEPLRVAILGVLAPHKGARLVAACADHAQQQGLPIEFHIVGYADPALQVPKEAPLFETGAYSESEAGAALARVAPHLVWFPARWPETYSYTLNEALTVGLPIVASNFGAFCERLRDRPWTWLLPVDSDPDEVLTAFEKIRRDFLQTDPAPTRTHKTEFGCFYRDGFFAPVPNARPRDIRNPEKLTVVAVLQCASSRFPAFVESAPDACGYIRGLLPLEALAADGFIDFVVVDAGRVSDYIADIFFTQRSAIESADQAKAIITHCRQFGMKTVYDIDDDLFCLKEDHSEFGKYGNRLSGAYRFLEQADLVIASTGRLKDRLLQWNDHIEVVPNALDETIWDLANDPMTASKTASSEPLRLLYMGTMTHGADLQLIEAPLRRLAKKMGKRIKIEIIGVAKPEAIPAWCEYVPIAPSVAGSYPAFVQWLQARAGWQIGVAPLVASEFNRAKSGIKYLDYAALGLASICSDSPGYSDIVRDGEDGILVENSEAAWYKALSRLVRDSKFRQRLQSNARQKLRQHHLLRCTLDQRHSLLKALRTRTETAPKRRPWLREPYAEVRPTREAIAHRFLKGQGIEIGALQNPLTVPQGVSVQYLDRMAKNSLYEHYPELRDHNLVDVGLIDDGETLATIADDSQNFVIANHFLEHCQNPLGTLRNLIRVLRPEGILYAAVPDRRQTFDRRRDRTTLDHLIEDYENGPAASRRGHFLEWVRLVEPEFGRIYDSEEDAAARADALEAMDYSIHFHVWEAGDVWELLHYTIEQLKLPVEIAYFGTLPDEILFVLRKC